MTSVPLNYSWQGPDMARRSLSNSPSTSSQLQSASVCPLPFLSWPISLEAFDWGLALTLKYYKLYNELETLCLFIEFLFLGKICEFFSKASGEYKF